jgi:hypothetical protein
LVAPQRLALRQPHMRMKKQPLAARRLGLDHHVDKSVPDIG